MSKKLHIEIKPNTDKIRLHRVPKWCIKHATLKGTKANPLQVNISLTKLGTIWIRVVGTLQYLVHLRIKFSWK